MNISPELKDCLDCSKGSILDLNTISKVDSNIQGETPNLIYNWTIENNDGIYKVSGEQRFTSLGDSIVSFIFLKTINKI